MPTAALGIMCKAPRVGLAKTRLASVLGAEGAAVLSSCFLRDVAAAIDAVPMSLRRNGFGVYSPAGCEAELRAILPGSFELVLQDNADFGIVLLSAARGFLEAGHDCAILINSDSPTLPPELLSDAIKALRRPGDRVVLGPATDGGYYLIGLKAPHAGLFRDIAWSTADVLRLTCERARYIGLAVVTLPIWYDVDDATSFAVLERELAGERPPFAVAGLVGGPALTTRAFVEGLRRPSDASAVIRSVRPSS
jgi:rSAM/selenodomain-associated transferase 1